MSFKEQDDFIAELRVAITLSEEHSDGATISEAFLRECFTTKLSKPFKVKAYDGRPKAHLSTTGVPFEEVGYDGTPETCGKSMLISDRMETAVSMFASFISSIQGRKWVLDHDVIEFRIWPEIMFTNYGRAAKFYARLVTYNSKEAKALVSA